MREDAAQEAPQADVDADDAVPALEPRELDLVRPHEPGAVDVDQLAVEDVLLQQHLLRPPPEVLEVELLADQRHEAGAELDDLLGGDEDRAPRDGGDDSGDGRIVVVAEADDQVVDAAEPLAGCVAQVAADDEREMEDRGAAEAIYGHPPASEPALPAEEGEHADHGDGHQADAATNAAHELKPGKWTFIPKKPVRNVSGSITTLKIVST